ncbi:MAG TPA: KH domain-containing protein [Verrucomicrobiae bacterium]|nr:KH domain-containing protein [Verrucomicrobiae bacterium]
MESPRHILEMILGTLGFVFEVHEEETSDGLVLQVRTRDPGRLIGREGHTLEDLQFLVNRLSHSSEEVAQRVVVDVEGYRTNQRRELVSRLGRIAQRVRQTGEPIRLEPMNSFDRRIVHNVFQDDRDVEAVSPPGESRLKRMTVQLRNRPRAEGANVSATRVSDTGA